jgi:hypothetical protein
MINVISLLLKKEKENSRCVLNADWAQHQVACLLLHPKSSFRQVWLYLFLYFKIILKKI